MRATKRKGAASRRPKPRKASRKQRRAPQQPNNAIILHRPSVPAVQVISAVPSVVNTMKSLEQVRRFVSQCMNVDLQKALAKLKPGEKLDSDVRERLEVDWGTIPGVDKPFLKQPGAEKVLFWLNLRPSFSKKEHSLGDGHLEIVAAVKVITKKTNEEVFEGPDCSCSTMESNYRFRFEERVDREGNPVIPDRQESESLKARRLGKFKKKAVWARGRKTGEVWVWLDRIENPNIHDERNKVRQIGQKRALVKCVRNMGALSEIFVSDPADWQLPEEEFNAGPVEDSQYTEGGRRIITEDADSKWKDRGADCFCCGAQKAGTVCSEPICPGRFPQLTQDQHAEMVKKMRSRPEGAVNRTTVGNGAAQARRPDPPRQELTYREVKGGKFVIEGPENLLRAHEDLFADHHDKSGKIIVLPEVLGKLIRRFEERKVPFHMVMDVRESGAEG